MHDDVHRNEAAELLGVAAELTETMERRSYGTPVAGWRRRSRSLMIGLAVAVGACAACSTRLVSATSGEIAVASPAPSPSASPAPVGSWPRVLPAEPGQWLRHAAAECGLRAGQLRSEARATSFPLPSGAAVVVWEVALRMGAAGPLTGVRALLARLKEAPCTVNVPELDLTWEAPDQVRVELHAVLLGTWPARARAEARP